MFLNTGPLFSLTINVMLGYGNWKFVEILKQASSSHLYKNVYGFGGGAGDGGSGLQH